MTLVEYTEFIVKSLVPDSEDISVKEFESENENEVLIQVLVKEEDMGKVIGRGGKVANAIRTLVQASSYLKDNKRVKINVEKF